MSARSADQLMEDARERIDRVRPEDLERLLSGGGLLVDIRPAQQRATEGEMPGALVIERNVLEWRFDLLGDHHIPEVSSYEQAVVLLCSEGYASSFAAASLRDLGFRRAADLEGGYRAWQAWTADTEAIAS
jgi:rhodanese-related sulfurtransferase